MNQVILYVQENGSIAIVYPTEEALEMVGITEIADRDVPAGKPYRIVYASELPEERDGLTIGEHELTDGVGSGEGVGSEYA
jgi:hypothetical protein